MCGAGGLARGGTGVVAVYLVIVAVVGIPLFGTPVGGVGKLLLGILHGAVLGAELLTELRRAGGADLYTLAARHALFLVNMGDISAAGEVGGVIELGGTQGIADAGGTVADGEYLVLTVDVGDLVDIALFLGAAEDVHHLLVCSGIAVLAGLVAVSCTVANGNAPVVGDLAGALAAHALGAAAGADADRIVVVFLQPV